MKPWQSVLVLIWVEAIAISLVWVHVATWRDPARNRVTRFVDGYYRRWVKHPLFGFGVIRSVPAVLLMQASLAAGLGLFFLVVILVGGLK
jgi:hypothetical protein